jgi:hypothetical protein
MSLTVRTALSFSAVRISSRCFSSFELIKRMRQSEASCAFEKRRKVTGLPSKVSSEKVESSQKDPDQHADGERILFAGRKRVRPFDESAEIVEIGGF